MLSVPRVEVPEKRLILEPLEEDGECTAKDFTQFVMKALLPSAPFMRTTTQNVNDRNAVVVRPVIVPKVGGGVGRHLLTHGFERRTVSNSQTRNLNMVSDLPSNGISLCRYTKDEDAAAAAASAAPASASAAPALAPTSSMKKVVAIQVPNMQLLEMIQKIFGQAGGGTQWMHSEDGRRRVQVTVRFASQARRPSIHTTE